MIDASAQQDVILTRGLSRRFGSTMAVHELDLTVAAGEAFGLIGPDGAGKSTTLRLLAGLMNPSAGTATVLGHDSRRGRQRIKQELGYMSQRFGLYGDLTVRENLAFCADLYGVPRRQRRLEIPRLLDFTRLEAFQGRRADHLSGGMRKKLSLACTLIHRPRLLLLDEPTTGVDPVSRREFWDMLADLRLQGISLIITTPYMDEAERCTRVGLLDEGRLIACDAPDGILDLVPGEAVAVWPSDLHSARQVLSGVPGVTSVRAFGSQLRVRVQDAQAAVPRLRAALQGARQPIREIRPDRIRMEEAFFWLVHDRGSVTSDLQPQSPSE
jgi:ABC-2 type transport system ATP-binding protein